MDSTPGQEPGRPPGYEDRLVVVGGYGMLLAFGALQGIIGSFQYPRTLGSLPVAAWAFAAAIGVTCVLGAWGMRRPLGGLMPAVGWFVATFALDMGTRGGSVVIANINSGQWFLFGGAACVVAGVLAGFVLRSPARRHGR